MPPEGTGRRKFPELVPYHVFGDIYRYELTPVVHRDGLTHKIRGDHGGAGPGLDNGLLAGFDVLLNFLLQTIVNVRSFFKGT